MNQQQCQIGILTSAHVLRHARNGGALRGRGDLLLMQHINSTPLPFNSSTTFASSRARFINSWTSPQLRRYSQSRFNFNSNPETSFLERIGLRRKEYQKQRTPASTPTMSYYLEDTPDEVKNAKGLYLLTMNTPNGQGTPALVSSINRPKQC